MSETTFHRWLVVIVVLALGLRIGLAVVNTSANDDHLQVIQIIVDDARLPTTHDASEGFQPKLYYLTTAAVLRLLPGQPVEKHIVAAQMINVFAGALTLAVVYRLISRMAFSRHTMLMAFALAALNPKFIAINAQVTNDSFVILFSTLAVNAAVVFFDHHRRRDLGWMCLFAISAALSKGNGLVVLPLIVSTFAIDLVINRRPDHNVKTVRVATGLVVFLLSFVMIVPVAGQYVQRHRDHGTPFITNMRPSPLPAWSDKTEVKRPGVRSVVDAFATFRIINLMHSPIITTQRPESYPEHRTSLWSQIFGRAHFVHFDQWPPAWKNDDAGVLALGRAIFVFALLPTALVILGFLLCSGDMFRSLRARRPEALSQWTVVIAAAGWLAFVMLYSLRFRDFSVMKFVFILPAIASWTVFFAAGTESLLGGRFRRRWAPLLTAVVTGLCILYCVDLGLLIVQLI